MEKKKPTTKSSLASSSCLDDVSGNAQRIRLLAYLRDHGAINTFEAIRLLNILRPGARIAELRAQGYNIRTHLATLEDEQGRAHPNVATYYLSTEPVGKVAA